MALINDNSPIDDHRDFSVPGWGTGPEGVVIYVQIRTARLNIHVEYDGCRGSPRALEKLVSIKSKLLSDDREETADAFDATNQQCQKVTLTDLSLQQAYRAHLEFHDEMPVPGNFIEEDPEEQDGCDYDYAVHVPKDSPFPRIDPSDVEVVYEDPATVFDIPVNKVTVCGQQLFWKPSWASEESLAGVEKYRRIRSADLSLQDELLTSRLYGIVVDGAGALRGQLYYWIDIGHHLTWDLLERTRGETRTKWVSQIRSTVSALHAIDVIWGDVKAENVVIDTGGNAIVIDLEGGATKGWVDNDKLGTRQGDLQGVEKLINYILNDECPLRARDKELDLSWDDAGGRDLRCS